MTHTEPATVLNLRTLDTDVQVDGDTVRLVLTDGDTTVHLSTGNGGAQAADGINGLIDAAGLAWEALRTVLRRQLDEPAGEKG